MRPDTLAKLIIGVFVAITLMMLYRIVTAEPAPEAPIANSYENSFERCRRLAPSGAEYVMFDGRNGCTFLGKK